MANTEIKNEKVVITLNKQDAVLLMDTDEFKFELMIPANKSEYAGLFKMFIWLCSGTETANKMLELTTLAFTAELLGATGEKPNMVEKSKQVVQVSGAPDSLVKEFFKNVGKK